MKIAIVCSIPDPRKGGLQVWTRQFIEWLAGQGHQVHLICQQDKSGNVVSPARVHFLSASGRSEFAAAAEALVKQLDVDVTHDMGFGWYSDIHHSHVGSPAAFRKVFESLRPWYLRIGRRSIAALLPRNRETKRLVARQLSSHDRETLFIALSRRIISDFETLHGIPRDQIELVPNGVDAHRCSPGTEVDRRQIRASMGINSDETVLLQVAHDHRLKGVPALLRAGATLLRNGNECRIVVVGGKPSRRTLKLAKQLGIEANVLFAGKTDNTVPFYQMADVYVHATHYDACSLSVLEAMACGLPVITTLQNGAADMIEHGRDGFVFDRQDTAALDSCLEKLRDRDVRQQMALAARQRAEQHSLQRNFEAIHQLYVRIADRKRNHLSATSLSGERQAMVA
jgi:UDP-glucose:(heptosyl)LPS alpha-1,3-glucosyltransferase